MYLLSDQYIWISGNWFIPIRIHRPNAKYTCICQFHLWKPSQGRTALYFPPSAYMYIIFVGFIGYLPEYGWWQHYTWSSGSRVWHGPWSSPNSAISTSWTQNSSPMSLNWLSNVHSDDCVSCESDSPSVSDENPSLSETSTLTSNPSEREPSESLSALSSNFPQFTWKS